MEDWGKEIEELEKLLKERFPDKGKNIISVGKYHCFISPKGYKEFIKALKNEFKIK